MDKLILMILISSLTVMPNTFVKCAPPPGSQEIPETSDDDLSPAGQNVIDPLNPDDVIDTESEKIPDESPLNTDNKGLAHPTEEDLSSHMKGDPGLIESDWKPNLGKKEDIEQNPDQDENGATLDESHETGTNDDIDSTPPTKDTGDEEARGGAKETLDESLDILFTTKKPQPEEESEEDDHNEHGENSKKQPKDSDTDLSNEENDDGPKEAPLITASTLVKSQVSPSASSAPVKASTNDAYPSTKKAAISTRSTIENIQPNTEGRTSQYMMPSLPTSHRRTIPDVPPWSSMAPSMSTAGLQQPGKPTIPWFYHTGPSSRPLLRNVTSPHGSTTMTESEPTEGTTPETSTESPLGATTTTATDLDINLETTAQPSTTSTTTEESTTTPETTEHVELIVPDNIQTEAQPALEYTTTFAGVVEERTTKGADGPHDRKRPPVKLVSGREGESSVPHEGEEVEKESTKPTTTADETTACLTVAEKTGVIKYIKKHGEEIVKQVGAFKVSLILLAVIALSFVSVFFCCKLCKRKGYRMRQRKLKEFGQENDFLLRDRNKGNKYNSDTVTLLEGSSEDEF